MAETVVEQISRHCMRARYSELPLIMLDTNDVELALEVGLHCGAVFPLPKNRKREMPRFEPYQVYLRDATSLQFETDYSNMFASWTPLLTSGTTPRNMKSGMYVLKLDKRSWSQQSGELDSRINWLRQYIRSFIQEPDFTAPVRSSCILLYGDISMLPEDLMGYTEIVEEPYPDRDEIELTLRNMACAVDLPLTDEAVIRDITIELAGFSRHKLRTLLRGMIHGRKLLNPQLRREEILNVKKQFLLQTGGLLTLEEPEKEWRSLGGMQAYKNWVSGDPETSTPGIKARLADPRKFILEKGIPPLKGVLLCGVPGCGKSEAAKVLHQELNQAFGLPMVRLSISKLMGGVVGESERQMRLALKQAEAMAPCIVFIDELDKGFSGASGDGNSDGGAFKRMFGDLLTWMQENDKGCFIFATANDISQLPPEFFRSGRFDALYSVFLPTQEECISIFQVHMEKAQKRQKEQAKAMGLDPKKLPPLFQGGDNGCDSPATLNTIMEYFVYGSDHALRDNIKFVSGADIEKIVITALEQVPMENDPNGKISVASWKQTLKNVIDAPTLNTQGGSITGLNAIAECYLRLLRGNFVPVSGNGQVLLKKECYRVTTDQHGGITGKYEGTAPEKVYDQALFDALVTRINRIAPGLERWESQFVGK